MVLVRNGLNFEGKVIVLISSNTIDQFSILLSDFFKTVKTDSRKASKKMQNLLSHL